MEASRTESKKRKADFIILSLAAILLLFMLLFSSLYSTLDKDYFDYPFERYGVYGQVGENAAVKMNDNILGFLRHQNELDTIFFMPDEISHLNDVRRLIDISKIIYYSSMISLIMLLLFLGNRILRSSVFILSFLIILFIIFFFVDFNTLFIRFHEIFFTGNYAFDPATSNMKSIYPDELFFFLAAVIYLKLVLKSLFTVIAWKYLYSKSQKY